jgi:uncharacterized protein (TIRG00374 family)
VAFALVGVDGTMGNLLPVYLASNVANALAPTGGAAAAALFIENARARGQSAARAAVGVGFVLFADLATVVPFLGVGLWFLQYRHDLKAYETLGALSFVALLALLIVALHLARRSNGLLEWVLGALSTLVNAVGQKLRRRTWLAPGWATRTAEQFAGAAHAIARNPRQLGVALSLALALNLISATALMILFVAYQQPVAPGALLAGFGLGIVFYVISVIPQGIAVVEGVMALVFTSLGYPGHKVAAIVLTFRGLRYWMPIVVGMLFVRRLVPARLNQRAA